MDKDVYTSRGKGYAQIARDSKRLLEAAVHADATGRLLLGADDIEAILQQVDDREHFADPMAQALLELILERAATIVLPAETASEPTTQ
jgi:hypothetical protein